MLTEFTTECKKCRKEFKTFGATPEKMYILHNHKIIEFCNKCSKEFKKLVDNWLK